MRLSAPAVDTVHARFSATVNPDDRVKDILPNENGGEITGRRAGLRAGGGDAVLKFLRRRTEGMPVAKPAP